MNRIGHKLRLFEQPNEGAATPSPSPDRVAMLEQRLSQVGGAVETLSRAIAQQDAQTQQNATLAAVDQQVSAAQVELTTAQGRLQQAYEQGDAAAIAAATAALSTAATKHTAATIQADHVRTQARQPAAPAQARQPAQQDRVDDTNLRQWRDRHSEWYGVDPDITREAHSVAREIEGERVLPVGSQAYFNAIDARLRAKYPDRFARSAPGQTATPRGNMNGSSSPGSAAIRIPASVAEGYRRMGLNVDDPAVVRMLADARETAVKMGVLPSTPVDARILQR